jgi:pilus assembly protein Flp/PilA
MVPACGRSKEASTAPGTPLRDPETNERTFDMYGYLKTWLDLKTDKRAVTALEYGLIAAVIIAVAVGGFSFLGNSLNTTMSSLGSVIN